MKRRKLDSAQLSLLEPTFRWSELSLDVREELVEQLARLLLAVGRPANQSGPPPSTTDQEIYPTWENQHDSR
jgi:hypothetical protein